MDTEPTIPVCTFEHRGHTITVGRPFDSWIVEVHDPAGTLIFWESGFASETDAAQAGRRVADGAEGAGP